MSGAFFLTAQSLMLSECRKKAINPYRNNKWHTEKRSEMLIVFFIVPFEWKKSMISSIPADEIWDRSAVQRGEQQYLRCLPQVDQRGINHTEAGRGLHKWKWNPSKCKCAWGLQIQISVHAACLQRPRCLFANPKLPSSKAQNCCTEKTGQWRSGLEHQSKLMTF